MAPMEQVILNTANIMEWVQNQALVIQLWFSYQKFTQESCGQVLW